MQPPRLLVYPLGALGARLLAAAGSPSLLPGPPRLLTRLVPGLPDLLPHFVADPPGLLARVVLGLPDYLAPFRPGLSGLLACLPGLVADVGGRVLARPAGLTSRKRQFLAEAADGLPDVLPHLADDVADRGGQFFFELVELVAPAAELLATGLSDPVNLTAVYLVVSDQAFFLEPGQPGVDRAW